ncbi:MAG: glycosyltransferase [Clostridia bacterium]|nr:glycosyltransferase [Clostridia bacterium]
MSEKNIDQNNLKEGQTPLVSIIIPVYNAAKYLKTAIYSIIWQNYGKFEIICVNDGSTDSSLEVLQHLQKLDDRIKIIDKPNGGPASARNAGLEIAKGKYINFVDADDRVEPGMYDFLVKTAEAENADIVVFGGNPIDPNENTPEWIWKKLSPKNIVYSGEHSGTSALFTEESSRPFLWLHFIKRSLLEQEPKLRLNEALDLGEDQLFQFMYFPRAKKVVFTDKKFYNYRWYNEGSLMWQYYGKKVDKYKKHLLVVRNVFAEWKKAKYEDPYYDLVNWAVNFLYYDLITFPKYLQYEFATEIMSIFNEYGYPVYMCNEWEMDHALEIQKLSETAVTFDDESERTIGSLKSEIAQVEFEITDRMNSKAYKVGRLLTSRKKRLDEKSVLPPEKKKN